MKTVTVNAEALRQLLQSLVGSPHEIRELQVTREVWKENPLNILIKEFNDAVEKHNALHSEKTC